MGWYWMLLIRPMEATSIIKINFIVRYMQFSDSRQKFPVNGRIDFRLVDVGWCWRRRWDRTNIPVYLQRVSPNNMHCGREVSPDTLGSFRLSPISATHCTSFGGVGFSSKKKKKRKMTMTMTTLKEIQRIKHKEATPTDFLFQKNTLFYFHIFSLMHCYS